MRRQYPPGHMGRDFKLRDDGDGLDFGRPWKFDVVADAVRGLGRLHPSVNTSRRFGENLAEGNLRASHILGFQWVQIRADEPSEESRADIVGMAFCSRTSEIEITELPAHRWRLRHDAYRS